MMKEKVIFGHNHEPYFLANGLRRFDDFFEFTDGQIINQNSHRNVVKFNLSGGGDTKTLYMKRFFNPHIKDMLFTLRHFGRFCSQAELEWRNANILLDNGLETYHPMCYGVRTAWGIERQSFLITEDIKGVCLLDYLLETWQTLRPEKQKTLVTGLGEFFKKIHRCGLSVPDAYIWHVYMIDHGHDGGDHEFGMIDLHRMQPVRNRIAAAAMNLGRFFFSLPEGFMDPELEEVFMDIYLQGTLVRNKKAFINRVRKWEGKLKKRRRKIVTSLPATKDGASIEQICPKEQPPCF